MVEESIVSQGSQIMVIGVAVVSFVFGLLVSRVMRTGGNNQELKQAQKELADYKETVSQHFGKTADLVDNLTSSYKDVFEHLGNSAKELLTEEQVKQHLASRAHQSVTLTYVDSDDTTEGARETAEEVVEEMPQAPQEDSDADAHDVMNNVANNAELEHSEQDDTVSQMDTTETLATDKQSPEASKKAV